MFASTTSWLTALSIVLLSAMAIPAAPQNVKSLAVEYQVYDAVLNTLRFPKQKASIKIANKTLNTGCGEASGNPVLMNGCGMFGPPSTADATYETARQLLPDLHQSTWKNMLHESVSSQLLRDSFHTSLPHEVFDITKAQEGRAADGIIFLSSIGFSDQKNEALIYVLFFSYMAHVTTSANLFSLKQDASGIWRLNGRLTVMETQ